jgi:hypothetical protein
MFKMPVLGYIYYSTVGVASNKRNPTPVIKDNELCTLFVCAKVFWGYQEGKT